MGTTLTGTTPQDTYDSLIKVTDNGPIGATPKLLSDGLGNDSSLALSTSFTAVRGGQQLRVYRTDNATYGSIQYLTGAGGFKFDDVNADGYTFAQGASTPMAISAAGNVGIGTSNPLAKLHVAGENIIVDRTGGDPYIDFFTGGVANSVALYGGASTGLRAFVGGAERIRVTTNGLTFNGDTAAANALDDYEEGTWTATLTDGTVSKTATCSYTKIGRTVYLAGGISNVEDPSAFTGNVYITGVPFVPAFSVSLYGFNNYLATASVFTPYLESNQVIRFYKVGAASADNVQMQGSDLDFYSDIYFAGQLTV